MENELLSLAEALVGGQPFAVGNDLVFITAFEQSFNHDFRDKVFTDREILYCNSFDNSLLRYASTWAAKESVYKAVKQLDSKPLAWKNIEIIRERAAGRPEVQLPDDRNDLQVSLSISHDGDYAWAVALIKRAAGA